MTELAHRILDMLKIRGTDDFDFVSDYLRVSHDDFSLAISEFESGKIN